MNSTRKNDEHSEPSQKNTRSNENRHGSASGFEGMNFEEQRESYKNSDLGGAKDKHTDERNRENERNKTERNKNR
jgi:hypothetical protein